MVWDCYWCDSWIIIAIFDAKTESELALCSVDELATDKWRSLCVREEKESRTQSKSGILKSKRNSLVGCCKAKFLL